MTKLTPLVGCATFALFMTACPPVAPSGLEYCDSAASTIVSLRCTESAHSRVLNACRVALDDGRNWHPKQIANAKTCDEINTLIEGGK